MKKAPQQSRGQVEGHTDNASTHYRSPTPNPNAVMWNLVPKEAWPSVRAREVPHRVDAVTGQHSPGFDLSHIGRLGKAAKQLARLLARGLPWQREGLAPKRASAVGRAASDIPWATGGHAH